MDGSSLELVRACISASSLRISVLIAGLNDLELGDPSEFLKTTSGSGLASSTMTYTFDGAYTALLFFLSNET